MNRGDAGILVGLLVAVLAIDAVWLFVRRDYHEALFRTVQGGPITVRVIPAAIVYALIALGLWYFAIKPAKSRGDAVRRAGLLGGLMYAFYDATNLATLRGWTWSMAIVDSMWGAIVSAAATWTVLTVAGKN
jgi:uncharacterized membrane protein